MTMQKGIFLTLIAILALASIRYILRPRTPYADAGKVATAQVTWSVGDLNYDWSQTKIVGVLDGNEIAYAELQDDSLSLAFSMPRGRQPKDVVVRLVREGKTIFERPYDDVDNGTMRTALTQHTSK
jgi:hypothetical protein